MRTNHQVRGDPANQRPVRSRPFVYNANVGLIRLDGVELPFDVHAACDAAHVAIINRGLVRRRAHVGFPPRGITNAGRKVPPRGHLDEAVPKGILAMKSDPTIVRQNGRPLLDVGGNVEADCGGRAHDALVDGLQERLPAVNAIRKLNSTAGEIKLRGGARSPVTAISRSAVRGASRSAAMLRRASAGRPQTSSMTRCTRRAPPTSASNSFW